MSLIQSNNKMIAGLVVLTLFVIIVSSSNSANAQRRSSRPGQRMYVGVEGALGTQSFSMKSDIPALNNMPVSLEGGNFGLMVGNKVFHTTVKQGYYNSSSAVSEKLGLIESSGAINLYPLQLKKRKFRYFEPYFTVGADHSTLKLYGTYINQSGASGGSMSGASTGATGGTPTPKTPVAVHPGGVICGGSLPADPDAVGGTGATGANATGTATADPNSTAGTLGTATEGTYLGKIISSRANIGFGLECHIPGLHHFVNLFAGAKYGIPVSMRTADESFKSTKSMGVFAVNFGVSFGFSR